jgi:hypothetical protein
MVYAYRVQRPDEVCDETRPRRYGYQLRCLEPPGHDGPHRWTPELVADRFAVGSTRPASRGFTGRRPGA